jgi:8-oxo-dGTP diphosphatase
VHNGDTWGIPGGARDSHESTIEGAYREAVEETGIDVKLLTPVHTFCDDHGNWRYETVLARATDDLVAHEVNDESHELRWIEIDQVESLTLHPSLRNCLIVLLEHVNFGSLI